MIIGDVFVRVLGETKQFGKDVEAGAAGAGARGGKTAGARFAGAFSSAGRVIGPAIGASMAEGIDAAAQFKDQLATIETVAGKGAVALNGLDKGALELSKSTGKPIEDITAGMYDLVSAGVPANKVMEVLGASANLAIGGLGSTADAVDAVSSAMNAYGQETYSASQITDVFAQAVAAGKVTTAEIGSSIATVAPIAAQAGIGIEEVGAAYATLTAQGVPAAEATTKMRSAIVALISPNETLLKVQKATGINFAKLAKEKGLAVALETLRTSITGATGDLGNLVEQQGGADAAFSNSLGRVEAYQFALATTGENLDAFGTQVDLASAQLTDGGLAAEQAAIKMDSPVEAGKRLAAQFKALTIETFGPFADSLGPGVVALNQMGGALGALVKPATLAGGALGKIATKVGPKLFGPLGKALSGALAAGASTGIVSGIKDGVAEAASSGAVKSASGKLGNLMGSKLGKGLSVAFAAVAIVEVVNTYNEIKAGLDEQSKAIGEDVGAQIKAGTTESLQQSKAALEQGVKELSDLWYNPFAGGQKDALQAQLDATNAELQKRAAMAPQAVADKLVAGQAEVDAAAATMADGIPGEVAAAGDAAATEAGKIPGDIGDAIESRRDTARSAMEALKEAMLHPMSNARERARLIGYLTSKRLAEGLASNDPLVRARAEQAQQIWLSQLEQLPVGAKGLGGKAGQALADALHSKNPAIREQARLIKEKIEAQIAAAKTRKAGLTAAQNAADGVRAGSGAVGAAAVALARKIGNQLLVTLRQSLTRSAEDSGNGGSRGRASGGKTHSNVPYLVGESGPELWMADVPGYVFDAQETKAMMSGGTPGAEAVPEPASSTAPRSGDINVSVYNPTPEPASTSTKRELRKMQVAGTL